MALAWRPNPLMELLGLALPIVQAPIGSPCTVELVTAASNAGALGVLPVSWDDEDTLSARLALLARCRGPVAINLVLEWSQEDRLQRCLDAGIRIISTFWGSPRRLTPRIHDASAIHIHSVGSVDEARAAADIGVDVIVAQGWEAGGHVRGRVGGLALIPEVVDAVAPIPVLAAGGICAGRALAAAMSLGAQGAWVGSAFLVATESAAHDSYCRAVLDSSAEDTVHGVVFDGGWPSAPHRVIRNATVRSWETAGRPAGGRRPGVGDVVAHDADGGAVLRYADLAPTSEVTGDAAAMALYAGQGVGQISQRQPAASIIERMSADALRVLQDGAANLVDPQPDVEDDASPGQ